MSIKVTDALSNWVSDYLADHGCECGDTENCYPCRLEEAWTDMCKEVTK